jgi:hypothetical protein
VTTMATPSDISVHDAMTVDGDLDAPALIVSSDTHIGPRLVEDLRAYCPQTLLREFDEFAAETGARTAALHARMAGRETTAFTRNHRTAGHYDMAQRLHDLDHDGVAAEVIFHGSQNEQPVPFGSQVAFLGPDTTDLRLVAAGRQIYNRWLADAVSIEPERQVGLAHLPLWDLDASVRELTWAREAGLRGVNFPAPRSDLPPFNDRVWERSGPPAPTCRCRCAPTPALAMRPSGPDAKPLRWCRSSPGAGTAGADCTR